MADRPATTSRKKKPGRKRRLAGWLFLVVGLLITGVWATSRWVYVAYDTPTTTLSVHEGVLQYTIVEATTVRTELGWRVVVPRRLPEDPTGTWCLTISDQYSFQRAMGNGSASQVFDGWLFGYCHTPPARIRIAHQQFWDAPDCRVFALAFWAFAIAAFTAGGLLLWFGRRAHRRLMSGICLKCGYNLAGLALDSPCPECGNARAITPRPPPQIA